MNATTPQRSPISSLNEVKGHAEEFRNIRPYICKEFAIIHNANPMQFIDRLFQLHVPYRMDNYRFLFFHHAKARGTINLRERVITDNTIGFAGPGSIVQMEEIVAVQEVSAVVMDEDYIKVAMGGRLPQELNGSMHDFYFTADEKEMATCQKLVMLLRELVDEADYSHETVASLFAALTNYICSLYDRHEEQQPRVASRGQSVLNAFIQLVNEHGAREHLIDFYADRLCITERYLGTIIKKESGISAKEWIDRAIMAEAKVALKHSDVTIAELSERLAFPNPSLFCRWFKRLEGMTPGKYRQ